MKKTKTFWTLHKRRLLVKKLRSTSYWSSMDRRAKRSLWRCLVLNIGRYYRPSKAWQKAWGVFE